MEWLDFSHSQRDRPAPTFRLESSRREPVAFSDYRGRRNLVVLFLPGLDCPGCRTVLENFADRYSAYRERAAEVLAVISGPGAPSALEETYPFPLLADPDGAARQAYGALLPTPVPDHQSIVFILDRYRAPYIAWTGPDPGNPALQDEFLDWLDFIEFQCPE
ncbi:MAG: redoxin domain-containing protein [Anaerolineae bacterium]